MAERGAPARRTGHRGGMLDETPPPGKCFAGSAECDGGEAAAEIPRLPKTADETTALVDTGDVHAVMIGAAGVAKPPTGCTPAWSMPWLRDVLPLHGHKRRRGAQLRQDRPGVLWVPGGRH